jgi:hypothetical protein
MAFKDEDYSYTDVDDPSKIREIAIMPSTIEDIDAALFEFVEGLKIHATTNKGFKEVPLIWTSAERTFQIKNNLELRDKNGSFILPSMALERTGFTKDLTRKGGVFGNAPAGTLGGALTVARRIVQDKTADNANADAKHRRSQQTFPLKNKKVVYETITIPIPVYIDVSYSLRARTEYQQQLNEIVAPFINMGRNINYFTLLRNGHKYETFVQSEFTTDTNLADLGAEERRFETKIDFKVLGYIIGDDKNQSKPKMVKKQNFVEVKIGRERTVVGDIPETMEEGRVKYRD